MLQSSSSESGQLDTMIAYCRGKLAKALALFTPHSDDDLPIALSVMSGRHAGCITQIEATQFSIGGDLEHDILLTDPDIAGPTVMITARQTLLGRVLTVTSERDDIRLNNIALDDGVGYEKLPCNLSIGSVRVAIEADQSVATAASLRHEVMLIAALVLMGIFAATIPSWSPAARDTVLQTANAQVASEPEMPADESLFQMLAEKIAVADLADYVAAQPGPDNTVTLSGAVPEGLMTQWRGLLSELDGTSYASRLLVTVKQTAELGNLPAISIVQLSGDPMLVLSSGQSLRLGDEIVDEWTIDAITASGVTLSRAGEAVEVTY